MRRSQQIVQVEVANSVRGGDSRRARRGGVRTGKTAFVMVAMTAVLATLTACGGTTASNSTKAKGQGLPNPADYFDNSKWPCPTIAQKPASSSGTVTYWSMWSQGEPQQKVLQKTLDCFTSQTGIKVDVQWIGRKVLTTSVAPALNTDNVPDLIDQDVNQLRAAVAEPGGLQSLSDVLDYKVDGDKTVRDVLGKQYWDYPQAKGSDGQPFLIPYEVFANNWWYDKNVLKGVTPPKSTADLFALMDKAKAAGIAGLSLDGDIDFYNAYYFTREAESYVGPGGLAKAAGDKTGQLWKSEPGYLEAAKFVEKIAKGSYLIKGWDASKFPQVQQQWADGKSGLIYMGSWLPGEVGAYEDKSGSGRKVDYASFPMPKPDGATHNVLEILPLGFAITKKAKNADAAKALIAYSLNSKLMVGTSAVAENLTPRADIPVPAKLDGLLAAYNAPGIEFTINMDGIDGTYAKWITAVFYPLDKQLISGKLTAAEFIDQMASGSAKFWSSNS